MLQLLEAQEIKLESLDNGPGILPFKLGSMSLTTHYHTFLQYIELDNIEDKIQSVYSQLSQIKLKLDNDTSLFFEHQLDHLNSRLDRAQYELKSLEPNRAKRGLIDGLGSVIKSISGNLDYLDAKKYDDALSVLKINQDNLITEFNSHISLSKDWMSRYSKVLTNIVENQSKINETLRILISTVGNKDITFMKLTKFGQLLTIVSENIDELSNELRRIEDTLAFTRTSGTHHSLLGLDTLRNMLDKLKSIYGLDQVIELDYREYYSIIQSGSYYVGKRIVIVFKFPIVSSHIYNLYKLAITPNKNNQVLIPPYPYIATYENIHVYIEAECPKLTNRYLCEEKLNHQIRTEPDCILKLINEQTFDKSCQMTTLSFTKEAMEKLDDRHYAIVLPRPTKIHLICDQDDYSILNGSYLATIPHNCLLRTKEFTITNVNDKIKGRPLKIIQSSFEMSSNETPLSPLKIRSANLNELHALQHRVDLQEQIVPKSVQLQPLYHTTIPTYGIILGTFTILIIVWIRRYKSRKHEQPDASQDHQAATPTPGPSEEQTQHHANFTLNVLK